MGHNKLGKTIRRARSRALGRALCRDAARGDGGQVTVELAAMAGLIMVTIMALWQCALVGYSMMLASDAADRAARAAAVNIPDPDAGDDGEDAGRAGLPPAWQGGSDIDVVVDADRALAEVDLAVPLLIPGWASVPMSVSASSAAEQ